MLTNQSTELQSSCPLRILLTVQIHTPLSFWSPRYMKSYTMCSNKTIDTIVLMLTALDLLKDIYSYMYHRRDLRK